MLISNFGLGLDYILMALAPNLWWLFVGRVISGMSSATIATSYAYVADVTPAEQRAAKFGMLGAAFGLGFVLGPALGGVLGAIDPRMPFWVAAGLSLLNGLYGLFVLPESLPREQRMPFEWRRANPVGSLQAVALASRIERACGVGVSRSARACGAAERLGALCRLPLWLGRARRRAFARGGRRLRGGGAGRLVGPVVKAFGERRALMFGLAGGIAGFMADGACRNRAGVLSRDTAAGALGHRQPGDQRSDVAACRGHPSRASCRVPTASIQGIANLVGPFVFTLTFAWSIGGGKDAHVPGVVFVLAARNAGRRGAIAWHATRLRD